MNPIQAVANKCWYVASVPLVDRVISGGISRETTQEVLESIPELDGILPSDDGQREQVVGAVFQGVQDRAKKLEELPAFVARMIPEHDDPAMEAVAVNDFMEQFSSQLEQSLIPPFEIMLNGDFQAYKNYLAEQSGDPSMKETIPCEKFYERIFDVVSNEDGREEKLRRLEEFKQLLAEDMPAEREGMLGRMTEIIWQMNNFAGTVFTPADKVEILTILDEEIDQYPQLSMLFEQFDGDVDKLIETVFSAQTMSALFNREFGQDTKPGDFLQSEEQP